MPRSTVRLFALACVMAMSLWTIARADTLHLKDGTSITGRVMDMGDKYWVKDADGVSHTIAKTDVNSVEKGDAAGSSVPSAGSSATGGRPKTFASEKAKADAVETPITAVGIWQSYIDSKPAPAPADLTAAKGELKRWQDMLNGFAEKINGKWVWGEDRRKLIRRVHQLIVQANKDQEDNQTLDAIAKYEEAVKLYPNSFEANFELGYFNLVQGVSTGRRNWAKLDAGVRSMEAAARIEPDSAAALSDLAIGYNFRSKYEQAVKTAFHAVNIEDTKETVQNLCNAIAYAPQGMRENNMEIKTDMQKAGMLALKYGISTSGAGEWIWIRPSDKPKQGHHGGDDDKKDDDENNGPPGIFANGSGFFITDNGYILTNRHVAKAGTFLMVKLPDGTEKLAKRIVIDDDQDLAVIKISTPTPVPFVRMATYDHPPTGASVYVFGFPLLSQFGLNASVKMTRGIVTAWDQDQEFCDVTVDANVNPGNSGGPMVDDYGNLLAITAMKTLSDEITNSYGLGLSSGRIHTFFDHQHKKLGFVHLKPAQTTDKLDAEALAAKLTPCTVCIFCCRGTPPTDDAGLPVKSDTP